MKLPVKFKLDFILIMIIIIIISIIKVGFVSMGIMFNVRRVELKQSSRFFHSNHAELFVLNGQRRVG